MIADNFEPATYPKVIWLLGRAILSIYYADLGVDLEILIWTVLWPSLPCPAHYPLNPARSPVASTWSASLYIWPILSFVSSLSPHLHSSKNVRIYSPKSILCSCAAISISLRWQVFARTQWRSLSCMVTLFPFSTPPDTSYVSTMATLIMATSKNPFTIHTLIPH
jgi:hypothetical protein